MEIEDKYELKWNNSIHDITTCKTDSKSLKHVITLECQQAIRLWKLNPVYNRMLSLCKMTSLIKIRLP